MVSISASDYSNLRGAPYYVEGYGALLSDQRKIPIAKGGETIK